MTIEYRIHNQDTAPEEARPHLEAAQKAFGFVPNILGIMAEAPPLLAAYMTLNELFEKTSFSPKERLVIILSISRANQCGYCIAAHTAGAQSVTPEIVEALRQGEPLPDEKLEALSKLARGIVEYRGYPPNADIEAFLRAGYTETNLLEVLVAVGLKTLSNYTNHIADTPLDEPLKKFALAESPVRK